MLLLSLLILMMTLSFLGQLHMYREIYSILHSLLSQVLPSDQSEFALQPGAARAEMH